MPKIAIFAKLTAQPGKGDEMMAVLQKLADAVQQEEGTEIYAAHRPVGDPDSVWFYELYRDQDAFAAHGSSDAMREFGPQFGALLGAPPEISMTELVTGKGVTPS